MNCPKCGREIDVVEGQQYCGHCGEKLAPDFNLAQETSDSIPKFSDESSIAPPGLECSQHQECNSPWEDENSTSFFNGLLLTIKQTLLNPADYFTSMPRSGKWWLPGLFYIIMGVMGAILGLISGFFVESPVVTHGALVKHMAISSIMALPILLFIELYFGAMVLHLSMLIFGAGREKFQTTLKIVAYSAGPNIFYAVPFVGWLLAGIWSFWITVIGIKVVGQVSTARALLVTLAPAFIVISVLIGLIFLIMGLVGISSLI